MKKQPPSVPPSSRDNVEDRLIDNSINDILTLPELAERLKVSVSGLRKVIKREQVPHFKVGQQIRVSWVTVANYLKRSS